MLTEPRNIVQAPIDHWNEVSKQYGKSKEECAQFLQKPGIRLKVAQYGAALFEPLSYDIVTEAHFCMVVWSALGAIGRKFPTNRSTNHFGAIVTIPYVRLEWSAPVVRKVLMHENICCTIASGKALKISAGAPSTPGDPPVFNLRRHC